MSQEKSRRRWYQFSLRTMLIVMVLSSAAFGWWVQRSSEWIRQRHVFLAANRPGNWSTDDSEGTGGWSPQPPSVKGWPKNIAPSGHWLATGLWLFGEEPVRKLFVPACDQDA